MKLYDYQQTAADWLAEGGNRALWDEQGLGKTVIAIDALRRIGGRALVTAPASVVWNWRKELGRWWPDADVHVLTSKHQEPRLSADVLIVTHGLLFKNEIVAHFEGTEFGVVVVDEAHYFKTPTTKRTTVLRDFYAPRAGAIWALTGTPYPNDPSELWALLRIMAPERLMLDGRVMSQARFTTRYCKTKPNRFSATPTVVGARNLDELKSRLRGFYMRRRLRDHIDLPPVRYDTLEVSAQNVQLRDLDAELPWSFIKRLKECDSPEDALAMLRDIPSLARYRRVCGELKVKPLARVLLEGLNVGQKAVVFCHHQSVADGLQNELAELRPLRLNGSVPASRRQQNTELFQDDPSHRVMIAQPNASIGQTLTAAHWVLFAEQSFVPGENAQAVSRCVRIGQTQPVLAQFLALTNSVDEIVARVAARKAAMIEELLG